MAKPQLPHFVLVPVMGQGHTIPMSDLAWLLAEHGARVSLAATPVNAASLQGVADRARRAMLPLEIIELPYPAADDRLPCGSEEIVRVFQDLRRLTGPLEAYVRALPRSPSCIISDLLNPWTVGVARSVGVLRLVYTFSSCFYTLCDLNVATATATHGRGLLKEDKPGEEERSSYVVPGDMPVRVEMNKDTWSISFGTCNVPGGWDAFLEEARDGLRTADGAVLNTFLDIEEQFVACYEAALGKPVWALGPFFVNNRRDEEALVTGSERSSVVTAWLDTMEKSVVTYVSFGSLVRMLPEQLYEVGQGLEDSGKPFLWVVKESTEAIEPWLQALKACTAGRGLVVRGWAHQVSILKHPAVGGFVTHCGWNSLVESIAYGVPVVTWPHFADQFMNEWLAVDVLGIGVRVATAAPAPAFGHVVRRGDVARAVSELMGDGEVAQERRRRAIEYGDRAHVAMEKGGSSYENVTKLLQSFMHSDSAIEAAS